MRTLVKKSNAKAFLIVPEFRDKKIMHHVKLSSYTCIQVQYLSLRKNAHAIYKISLGCKKSKILLELF